MRSPTGPREPDQTEGVGFEPTVRFPVRLISSQVPSTAQPPFLCEAEEHSEKVTVVEGKGSEANGRGGSGSRRSEWARGRGPICRISRIEPVAPQAWRRRIPSVSRSFVGFGHRDFHACP